MKVKELQDILKSRSFQIFIRDDDFATGIHVITTFNDFTHLTRLLLNAEVIGIYPHSKEECHIEIL